MKILFKTYLSIVLSISIIFSTILSSGINAEAAHEEGAIRYIYTDDGIEIVGYSLVHTKIVIPETINGTSVTAIGGGAFTKWYHQDYIEEIVLPNSIEVIGSGAFSGCKMLTSISIPESVSYIGDRAFENCTKLKAILIPDTVKRIGANVFENTAYYNNESNWESGLLYIGKHLVDASIQNDTVNIREGTLTIAESTFWGCEIHSINIPSSVCSINIYAFSGCEGLSSLKVDDNNKKYHDSQNCIIETDKKVLIAGCQSSVIPGDGSVIEIGVGAFYNTYFEPGVDIKIYEIPESVSKISDYAYANSMWLYSGTVPKALTELTIPENVTYLGDEVFWNCSYLENISLPNKSMHIGLGSFNGTAFYFNSNNWNDGILRIDNHIVAVDNNLVSGSITIDDSILTIASGSFRDCACLTSVTVLGQNTLVCSNAFDNCGKLEYIHFPTDINHIEERIFDSKNTYICSADNNGYVYKYAQNNEYVFKDCQIDKFQITWVIDGVEMTYEVEESSEIIDVPQPTKKGYTFIGWDRKIPTVMPSEDLVFIAKWQINSYKITWIIGTEIITENVNYGETITPINVPSIDGVRFLGWDNSIPKTMPDNDMTFTAIFKASYICPDCGNEILGEDAINEHIAAEARMKANVKIKNNSSSKTINYGETLKLTAIVTDMPDNIRIVWYVNGEAKGEGETFSVSLQSGSAEVVVKLVDENDVVLLDSSRSEISDLEIVSVKAGFFQKLISFFKNLFRISRIVIQSI